MLVNCSKDSKEVITPRGNQDNAESAISVEDRPGHYIVVFKKDESLSGKKEFIRGKALGLLKRVQATEVIPEFVYSHTIQGFSVALNPLQVEELGMDESVDYIEQDQTFTINQDFNGKKRGGNKPGGGSEEPDPQSTPWGIDTVGGTQDGTGRIAWIIDSGIDLDHPDLNVDVNKSRSFLSGKQSSNPDDQHGHGTHVAGTVAAINNSIGVVGVAAGATVISIRVLDRRGSGSTSGVIAGVDYVADSGRVGDVANMSLGGGKSTALDAAVVAASANVKFALAAGNESDDVDNHSPARVNGLNIYTVSAMDVNSRWAYFSNYSGSSTKANTIDYCAPGVSIHSTWKDKGYNTISGTSMAAPHVCGLLLMGSINSNGTVSGDPALPADPIAHK